MGLTIRPFASGVAGRIFGLFLVATLIPVVVFGLLALRQVDTALTERSFAALGESARSYGQSLYQRLRVAQQYLAAQAEDSTFEPAELSSAGLSEVWVFEAGETTAASAVVPTPIRAALSTEILPQRPRLVVSDQQVAMLVAIGDHRTVLVGLLDPGYLFGEPELFPYATDYCVWQGQGLLYCSHDISDGISADVVGTPGSSVFRWQDSAEVAWLAASWDLFVGSGFDAGVWRILAKQPAAVALASLNSFRATFPYVLLLSLIGATILASFQIRRTMRPLDSLMAGVERFSQREFEHRIELEAHGEFSALAGAMNGMAGRLDSQFDAMDLLAEVDRKILDADGIERVLEETLQRFRALAEADFAGVLLLDKDAEFSAQLYSAMGASDSESSVDRVELSLRDYRWFNEHPDTVAIAAKDTVPVLQARWAEQYRYAQVFALRLAGDLAGSLVLGWEGSPAQETLSSGVSRDFADRLTVALAAGLREAELHRRAHFDPLTGLPNRELLHDRLSQAVAQARDRLDEGADAGVGVMFIDLDRFKDVNDSMGHGAGDALLCEAGRRLQEMVSESATVSRIGGDEFVIVLPRYSDLDALRETARTVLQVLAEPFEVEGVRTYISASLGVARFPEDGDTVSELMRKADTAMYEAKAAGRGDGKLFSANMDVEVQHRANLQQELHRALENDEFYLVYQPQVRLQDQSLGAAEALLRWNHPSRGPLSPAEFIAVAEDVGLVAQLDDMVMKQAFAQTKAWLDAGIAMDYIAVNVSAVHFSGDFATQVEQRLKSSGLPPEMLEIELTESVFAKDLSEVSKIMAQLRQMGIKIAIDDFGTGYSSMSYIQDLVFDALKIDQSFVRKLPADRKSAAIAHAIIAMGRTLGKTVVAEGIETRTQLDCLTAMGCTIGQGYLFSKPLIADEFLNWIMQRRERLAS